MAAADLSQLTQTFLVHHGAGRVAGCAQDEEFGLVRDSRLQLLQVKAVAVLFIQRYIHRLRLSDLGQTGIGNVAGIGNEHLIALLQQCKKRRRHCLLAAAGHHDLLGGVDLQMVHPLQLLRNGTAQANVTVVGGIRRHALIQRLLGSLLDVCGRIEVGLTNLEMDYLTPLCFQFVCFLQHPADAGKGYSFHFCGLKVTHIFDNSLCELIKLIQFRHFRPVIRIILQHHQNNILYKICLYLFQIYKIFVINA